jgi:two-component system, NtrC family, sensor histidine kinase HydH
MVHMLKWILNKGLRFQIILILTLVLTVPAAVVVWNVLVPSKMVTAVRTMQENKLNNLLAYIDDNIDKTELTNVNGNIVNIPKVEGDITSKLSQLSRTARGTNIGMYLPVNKSSYSFGMLFNDEPYSNHEPLQVEDMVKGLNEDLNQVLKSKTDKIDYISYRGDKEILRCLHPIIYNNRVVAVAWADTLIPPELNYGKSIILYIFLLGPIGFLVGFILMIAIVKNLNNNISKIRNGLELMSNDFSYRIENMGGDIGKVVESINTMAGFLEKKEQIEEHLQRAEKLASLGQMISGVAHEIRNPLGIIRGTVQLMEKNFKNVEGLDEYVKIVKEQSDRENKVIQELLDYSRPSKQLMMQMNINLLINDILSFTNKYIQDRHVKLNLALEDDLPEIMMDCDKIKQVFVNIIINACEAMEAGGTLNIKTIKDSRWIKIYFEDTGVGMDEVQMKNIFNPYYTTKPKGTGLGLAISNGIIEMQGGYIEVTSKKGEGSIFVVALPCSDKDGEIGG